MCIFSAAAECLSFRLTNHGKQDGLPHLVDVVVFLDLEDDDASFGRILY